MHKFAVIIIAMEFFLMFINLYWAIMLSPIAVLAVLAGLIVEWGD